MFKYLDKINKPCDIKNLSIKELEELSLEIREFMIESINKTGGHLGSSLGTVELTLALHYIFDCPKDKIIWDIGHQSYTHKILTERKKKFHTIRQKGGISGFTNPLESKYDEFIGGHSSTSVSLSFGLERGLKYQDKDIDRVISIIGDASLGAGVALEAINHIGSLDSNMIIILNDNNMSISKTKGALSRYLTKIKLSGPILYVKDFIKDNIVDKLPSSLLKVVKKVDQISRISVEENFFEELGFNYIGPIDGHNIESMVDILKTIKNIRNNRPIFIHCITEKGYGYDRATVDNNYFHGITGSDNKKEKKLITNTEIFSKSLVELAKKDKEIMAISAAMLEGTGLISFSNSYPDRTFDVGIAEQHAVAFAAGLARSGLKPFVCIYSTFMQRAYDQVIHDVSISSLPVRFIMDRAGFVGQDGITHAGLYDYGMFLSIPNIIYMSPSNAKDLEDMISLMVEINDKPSFLRFSKGESIDMEVKEKLVIGKGNIIQEGNEIAVLGIGEIIQDVIKASNRLKEDKINITIADARFAKPIDEDLIEFLVKNHKYLIVIEEGFGNIFSSYVINILIKKNLLTKIKYKNICVPNFFINQGNIKEQKKEANLDKDYLYKIIKSYL